MSTSDLEVDIKHAESICFKRVRDFCFLDRITGAFPPETTKNWAKRMQQLFPGIGPQAG